MRAGGLREESYSCGEVLVCEYTGYTPVYEGFDTRCASRLSQGRASKYMYTRIFTSLDKHRCSLVV